MHDRSLTDPLRASRRMADIEPFHVMELLSRARELEAVGRDIVHMEVGEPDFPTPEPALDAAERFIRTGAVHYTPSLGIMPLREAIARFYADRYKVSVDPECVAVTSGASGALLLALGTLIDPGDEILLADPGYPCNRHFVRCLEGLPRHVPVGPDTAYQLTASMIEDSWGEATRGVLVATPANPTGTLISPLEMERISHVVGQRGGILIVDEIYHGLTYGADARTALASSSDAIVINSFSKYFGMTGWRLGWLVAPRRLIRDVEKLAQNLYISPSAPAQAAALAVLSAESIDILEARRREFQRRREFLLPALRDLGFSIRTEPDGAFYLYAEITGFGMDSHEFAHRLLEEAGVAVTPGIDFGMNAPERHVRFAYTTSVERLQAGVERIRRWLSTRARP